MRRIVALLLLLLAGPVSAAPLTLAEALSAAASGNLDVVRAAAEVDAATADRSGARADLLPTVSGAADVGWGNSVFSPVPAADASVRVSAVVPLLDLPALSRSRAAGASLDAATADQAATLQATLAEVARRYVALQQAREQVLTAGARLLRAERLRALAADRVELGAAPRIDLTRAELALRTEEARLLSAQTAAAAAEVALAEALGAPIDQPFEVTEARPLLDPGLTPGDDALTDAIARAQSEDPDLVAARARLEAASATRRAQAAAAAPTIAGYGEAGVVTDLDDASTTPLGSVGVAASIPLWAGGRRAADLAGARADEEDGRLSVLAAARALEAELRVGLRVWRDAGAGLTVADASLALAREELERAESRYREGAEGNLVVVSAQAEVAVAEQGRVDAVASYNRAVIGWLEATGQVAELGRP